MNVKALLLGAALLISASAPCQTEAPAAPQATPAKAPTKVVWLTATEATKVPAGETVYLRGKIAAVVPPREGSKQPWSIYVKDDQAAIRLVIFQETWTQIPDTSFLKPGYVIDVFGEGSKFEGTSQLLVKGPKHIRQAPGVAPEVAPQEVGGGGKPRLITVNQVQADVMGQMVTVEGQVERITSPTSERAPWRFVLRDHSGKIEVVCWPKVLDQVPQEKRFNQGDTVRVTALVCEFRNEIQLRVDEPSGWHGLVAAAKR